jgi:hypothetical protein
MDLRKQEQMATISRKHFSESDGIYGMESFILMLMKEVPVLKELTALVALMAGFAHPAFTQGVGVQGATVQEQDQAQGDVRRPPGDLFASSLPSPAESRRCAAGHRLNSISSSACEVR